MKIRYRERKLEKMVNAGDNGRKLQRRYGDLASKILQRVHDLHSAINLAVLATIVGTHLHPLKGDRKGKLAVWVSGRMRLVFRPANDPLPLKENEELDWTRVTEIVIEKIEDYHGKNKRR